jgi:hypothetical protein
MIVARAVEQPIDRHPCTTESCGFRTSSPASADVVAVSTLARVACSLQQNHEHFSVLPFVRAGQRCHQFRSPSSPPNNAFAQSPPGIGRKRPSLAGQPLGDPASGVPFGCRKCSPVGRARTPLTHQFCSPNTFRSFSIRIQGQIAVEQAGKLLWS